MQEECYRGSVTGVVLQEWRCRGSVAGGVTGGVLQEKRTGRVLQEECYRRSVKCWSSVYSTGCAAGGVL